MKITFLERGGAFPREEVGSYNNVLLETDAGSKILIDCGHMGLDSLNNLGIDPLSLDGVIVTHIHAGNVGGLEELGFQGLCRGPVFCGKPKIFDLYVPSHLVLGYLGEEGSDEYPCLWENYLKAGMQFGYPESNCNRATLDTYFNPVVAHSSDQVLELDGIRFIFVRTPHIEGTLSFGLALESERGTKAFYSADSKFESRINPEDFDIIFHDCLRQPHYDAKVVEHFEELANLPSQVREKIFLTYYEDADKAPSNLKGMRLVQKHQVFDI